MDSDFFIYGYEYVGGDRGERGEELETRCVNPRG